jgi:hypothetical protein
MNVTMLLDMAAEGFGDRVVVGRRQDGLTALRLRELSLGGGRAVVAEGADSILYLGVNGPAFPVAMFAAARAGVPLVPVNYRLGRGHDVDSGREVRRGRGAVRGHWPLTADRQRGRCQRAPVEKEWSVALIWPAAHSALVPGMLEICARWALRPLTVGAAVADHFPEEARR